MKTLHALALLVLLSLIFLSPIFTDFSKWGRKDWDQHTFYNAVPIKTVREYGQFPLWNPYYCGGSPLLANIQSAFLTPFFVFPLLLGEIDGMKLQVVAYFIAGLIGMYFLAKKTGIKGPAAILPPMLFMMSSMFSLKVREGTTTFFPVALLPWAFLFFLKSLTDKKHIISTALVLALIFFGGGHYALPYAILFLAIYASLHSFEKRNLTPMLKLVFICALTLLLGAVKFLPSLEFFDEQPRLTSANEGTTLNIAAHAFLDRNQEHTQWLEGQQYWWHEYGSYVGAVPLLLFILGAVFCFRKTWKLALMALLFFILYLGSKSPVNLWSVLHSFPVFSSMRIPSRFDILIMLCSALIAGIGLSYVARKLSEFFAKKRIAVTAAKTALYLIVFGILAFSFADLTIVSRQNLANTFTFEPLNAIANFKASEHFYQTNATYELQGYEHSSLYPVFLSNRGKVDCYEETHPPISALHIEDSGYRGEVYLLNGRGNATISYFSPNKIIVKIDAGENDTLILNQNYYKGWRTNYGEADAMDGLISKRVTPETKRMKFYYLPKSFIFGSLITVLSTSILFVYMAVICRRPSLK
ncbi:hypothetical protein HYV85_03750 [Candidatus Woesearchaeota archaeon]|nr:hypothetical protein [Candidatus Woesearchaeota archaeon]